MYIDDGRRPLSLGLDHVTIPFIILPTIFGTENRIQPSTCHILGIYINPYFKRPLNGGFNVYPHILAGQNVLGP